MPLYVDASLIVNTQYMETQHDGVAAAAVGKCAVSSLAQNITFFPGVWRVRNAWKINAWIEANWRGFLATL